MPLKAAYKLPIRLNGLVSARYNLRYERDCGYISNTSSEPTNLKMTESTSRKEAPAFSPSSYSPYSSYFLKIIFVFLFGRRRRPHEDWAGMGDGHMWQGARTKSGYVGRGRQPRQRPTSAAPSCVMHRARQLKKKILNTLRIICCFVLGCMNSVARIY